MNSPFLAGHPKIDPTQLTPRELLRLMARSRECDRREGILHRQSRGWFHLSSAGHEAMAALVSLFDENDYFYIYYRDRAVMLARGASIFDLALMFFGKTDAESRGRQMPAHFSAQNLNVISLASPTSLQCLPAVGTAWACKSQGRRQTVFCSIGDAAIRQGEFYEAVCLALQEKLPIIFLVEDNGFGISTRTEKMNPWNIGALSSEPTIQLNGRNHLEVHKAASAAVGKARAGDGPTILWANVDRLASHTSSDDQRIYRSEEELALNRKRDPIVLLRDELLQDGALTEAEWHTELDEIAREVDREYRRAERTNDPDPAGIEQHVYSAQPPIYHKPGLPERATWSMAEAVNETLRQEMNADKRILLFGEDLEDPKGGVFGLTRGLSTLFPDQVHNSPLAEATIAGVACGLAIGGYRPVFEIQFIDFVAPAFNQIVNQIATLRWRSAGAWKCPLVLIAACGAYIGGGGPWHSQTNEAWFAHAPGIQIAMPSTPQDAAALLRSAIYGDDPVLLLLPKKQFRQQVPAGDDEPVRWGDGRIRLAGEDVTLVSWGNCVEICLAASETMRAEGISAEVIDLRTIVPWDRDLVHGSIKNTGRLVVVHEDNRTCGFGGTIIAEITSRPDCWDLLAGPPQLVCRGDVQVPYHPMLEQAVLPDAPGVCDAVRIVMRY